MKNSKKKKQEDEVGWNAAAFHQKVRIGQKDFWDKTAQKYEQHLLEGMGPQEKDYRQIYPLTSRSFPFQTLNVHERKMIDTIRGMRISDIKNNDVWAWGIIFNHRNQSPRLANVMGAYKTSSDQNRFIRLLENAKELPTLFDNVLARTALLNYVSGVMNLRSLEHYQNIQKLLSPLRHMQIEDIQKVANDLKRRPPKEMKKLWSHMEKTQRGPRGDRSKNLLILRLRDLLCFWNGKSERLFGSTYIEQVLNWLGMNIRLSRIDVLLRNEPIASIDWLYRGLCIVESDEQRLVSAWPLPAMEISFPDWEARLITVK